jgi:hypothetical protein
MQFTKHEIKLLYHHMHFYDELRTGVKPANTPEREHFVKAANVRLNQRQTMKLRILSI